MFLETPAAFATSAIVGCGMAFFDHRKMHPSSRKYDCHTIENFPRFDRASNKSRVMPFTIGLDYGTNSARALVVDCKDGREIGTAVVDYPSGHQGILLNPADHHLARQNPADYLFALETATRQALRAAQAGRAVVFRRRR